MDHLAESFPHHFEVEFALEEDAVDLAIPDADVILDAYMRIQFTGERLARATNLSLFITATTGADHVDALHLEQRGIPLLTLQGQQEVLRNITPAAEHSWLLLQACSRRLRPAMQHVLRGEWDRNQFPGVMLRGTTLGLVGCGRIGQWMSRYANGFGMNVLGYDPLLASWPDGIEKSGLDPLLETADFISIHVPLNEDTRGLIGVREFDLVKPGAILVNTSRGEVIDEEALHSALLDGRIGAAGLDVLGGEPNIDRHPLVEYAREHDNLIITPHIGGLAPEAFKYVLSFTCTRIIDFFEQGNGRPDTVAGADAR